MMTDKEIEDLDIKDLKPVPKKELLEIKLAAAKMRVEMYEKEYQELEKVA
jgi:hypothetical protein